EIARRHRLLNHSERRHRHIGRRGVLLTDESDVEFVRDALGIHETVIRAIAGVMCEYHRGTFEIKREAVGIDAGEFLRHRSVRARLLRENAREAVDAVIEIEVGTGDWKDRDRTESRFVENR